MIALSVRLAVIKVRQSIEPVSNKVVTGRLYLSRSTGNDGIGRYDGVFGDDGMTGNDAIVANHGSVHDRGIDTNQAVVANGGAVNGAVVGDRTVRSDDRGTVRDMDHCEVLDVGKRTNFDVVGLGSHDHLGPDGDALL